MQNLQCTSSQNSIELKPDASIVIIGNNLGSRMMHFGYFETELHTRYPDYNLLIRNQSIPGNTPGFRPHSSRNRSEEHTSELQSRGHLVCRLLLEKKNRA